MAGATMKSPPTEAGTSFGRTTPAMTGLPKSMAALAVGKNKCRIVKKVDSKKVDSTVETMKSRTKHHSRHERSQQSVKFLCISTGISWHKESMLVIFCILLAKHS